MLDQQLSLPLKQRSRIDNLRLPGRALPVSVFWILVRVVVGHSDNEIQSQLDG